MELSALGLLGLLGIPLVLGSAILRGFGLGWRTDRLAYPGWAWLAGALAIGTLEGVHLLTGLGSPGALSALALFLAVLLRFLARRTPLLVDLAPAPAPRWEHVLFHAVLALVLAVTLQRILSSSLRVIIDDDEANFWALRAKVLFDGGFGPRYAAAVAGRELHNENYPLLNSMLQVWVFDWAGAITNAANRLPIQMCSLALIACAASAFRRASRPWVAATLLLALANTFQAEHAARKADADIQVALAALVAVEALRRGTEEARAGTSARAWLGLGSLAAAFLVWSKVEGLALFVSLVLGYALVRLVRERRLPRERRTVWPDLLRALPWLALPLLFQGVNWLHNGWFDAHGSHEWDPVRLDRARQQLGESVPLVFSFLARLAASPATSAIPAAFVVLVLLSWRRHEAGALACVPLASALFLLGPLFIWLSANAQYILETSSGRILFQLMPLQLLWLARLARERLHFPP